MWHPSLWRVIEVFLSPEVLRPSCPSSWDAAGVSLCQPRKMSHHRVAQKKKKQAACYCHTRTKTFGLSSEYTFSAPRATADDAVQLLVSVWRQLNFFHRLGFSIREHFFSSFFLFFIFLFCFLLSLSFQSVIIIWLDSICVHTRAVSITN